MCKTDFDTKNQLFNHIKETGHATATAPTTATGTNGSAVPVASSMPSAKDDFYSSEDERGRGKGKKGRGKRK